MKLSFSISSKSSSARPPSSKPPQSFNPINDRNHEETIHHKSKPQFVTFFDPSQNPSSNSTSNPIIPPTPNSNAKIKNLPLPSADEPPTESRFVLDTSNNGSSEPGRYGLMLRANGTNSKSQQGDSHLSEKRRFQELIKDLPDEELPDVPVDGFGAAILAAFGWVEGKPIGRNCKEDPKVFEYKPRAGTEGFGYVPKAPNSRKKNQKERDDHADDRDAWKKMGEDRSKDAKRRKYVVATAIAEKSPVRWLRSHIRVRIVSKRFGGGKMYLKKGEVVDVVGPTICDVRMDESGMLLQGVDQEILETALPKCGGPVIVLYGKYKGVYGSLVERDSGKERGVVRDADSHALINVLLEQIAEYVGDPSCIGY